jgi:hypothetical protein
MTIHHFKRDPKVGKDFALLSKRKKKYGGGGGPKSVLAVSIYEKHSFTNLCHFLQLRKCKQYLLGQSHENN